jgi:hypothetical protein
MHPAIRSRTPLYWLLAAALVLAAIPMFWFLAFLVNSDLHHHARFIAECIKGGIFPLDFIYYGSVALLSGFSVDLTIQLWASVAVVTVALVAKMLVTQSCLGRWLGIDAVARPGSFDRLGLLAMGLLLLFCWPLPGMNWYLGQFPPNVWHNSTTMALMPLAVLLFYHSSRFLETGESRRLLPTTIYCVLGFLTKPSLFFVFAPLFPAISLFRFGFGKRFLQSCIPVAAGGLLLVAYLLLLFLSPSYGEATGEWEPALALGWLDVWSGHSGNVPLSILNSLLLPLLFLIAYPRQFLGDLKIMYALGMLAAGLLLFSVVQETGPWGISGNLSWQNIVCNYLLHCAVVVAFVKIKRLNPRFRAADWVLVSLFLAEAMLGIAYLAKIVLTRDYF